MKIVLINTDPMVAKLIEATAKKTGIPLASYASTDEVDAGALTQDSFVFIDEGSFGTDHGRVKSIAQGFLSCLLYAKTKPIKEFAHLVKKPFLPTEILDILQAELLKVGQDLHNASNLSRDDLAPAESIPAGMGGALAGLSELDPSMLGAGDESSGGMGAGLGALDAGLDDLALPPLPESSELDSVAGGIGGGEDLGADSAVDSSMDSSELDLGALDDLGDLSAPEMSETGKTGEIDIEPAGEKASDEPELNFLEDDDMEELSADELDALGDLSADSADDVAKADAPESTPELPADESALDGLDDVGDLGIDLGDIGSGMDENLESESPLESAKEPAGEPAGLADEKPSDEAAGDDVLGLDTALDESMVAESAEPKDVADNAADDENAPADMELADIDMADLVEDTPAADEDLGAADVPKDLAKSAEDANDTSTEILPQDEVELVKTLLNEPDTQPSETESKPDIELNIDPTGKSTESAAEATLDSGESDLALDESSEISETGESAQEPAESAEPTESTEAADELDLGVQDSADELGLESLEPDVSADLESSAAIETDSVVDSNESGAQEIAADKGDEAALDESEEFADITLDDLAQVDQPEPQELESVAEMADITESSELDSGDVDSSALELESNAASPSGAQAPSDTDETSDFLQLSEKEICEALGEEIPQDGEQNDDKSDGESDGQDHDEMAQDIDSSVEPEAESALESAEPAQAPKTESALESHEESTDSTLAADELEPSDELAQDIAPVESSELESSELESMADMGDDLAPSKECAEPTDENLASDVSSSDSMEELGALGDENLAAADDETTSQNLGDEPLDENLASADLAGDDLMSGDLTGAALGADLPDVESGGVDSSAESMDLDSSADSGIELDTDSASLQDESAEISGVELASTELGQDESVGLSQDSGADFGLDGSADLPADLGSDIGAEPSSADLGGDLGEFGAGLQAINALRDEMQSLGDLDPFASSELSRPAAPDRASSALSALSSAPALANRTQEELFSELLANKSAQEIRSLLNGAQISINISFSDKS